MVYGYKGIASTYECRTIIQCMDIGLFDNKATTQSQARSFDIQRCFHLLHPAYYIGMAPPFEWSLIIPQETVKKYR
jgi:hypothetical protein